MPTVSRKSIIEKRYKRFSAGDRYKQILEIKKLLKNFAKPPKHLIQNNPEMKKEWYTRTKRRLLSELKILQKLNNIYE